MSRFDPGSFGAMCDAPRSAERREALVLLIAGKELPAIYKDHPLKGDWKGYRDAHLEPGWLLIYRIVGDELQLARAGSHADLFTE